MTWRPRKGQSDGSYCFRARSCSQLQRSAAYISVCRRPNRSHFRHTGALRHQNADSGEAFIAKEPLGQSAAVDGCEMAAKQAATHPSTVSFSRVWDLAYIPHVSGRARVVSTFTAKNAFDLELKFRIDCLFDGPSLIEANIAESSD